VDMRQHWTHDFTKYVDGSLEICKNKWDLCVLVT
jgi:hypothetical protein